MPELYVILHESQVFSALGDPAYGRRVEEVRQEIAGIRGSGLPYVEKDFTRPTQCDPLESLPPPSDDLRIRLVGAHIGEGFCLNLVQRELAGRGYRAEFHTKGCLEPEFAFLNSRQEDT